MKQVKNKKPSKKHQVREKDKNKFKKNNKSNKDDKNKSKQFKLSKEAMNVELQNIDFDKADEALLKAKKKKLDDAFKKVDREDVLFAEVEFSDQEGEVKNVLPSRRVKGKNINSQSKELKESKGINDTPQVHENKFPNKRESNKRPKKLILHENVTQEKKIKLDKSLQTIKNKHQVQNEIKNKKTDNIKFKEKTTNVDTKNLLINEEKSRSVDNLKSAETNNKLSISDICPSNNDEVSVKKKKGKNKKNSSPEVSNGTKESTIINHSEATILDSSDVNRNKNLTIANDGYMKDKLEKIIKKKSRRRPLRVDGSELRQRMMERVKAAQFRLINETLYTSSGQEAKKLFEKKPEAFQAYHEGFRQQVRKWPVNPVKEVIKRIKALPKSNTIADMGCGDATLAKSVPHKVHSFDLVAAAPGVVACDIAHTPLESQSVDAVVFCLALMGTELQKYLAEANRILKTQGKLLIAEVESRFEDVNAFLESVEKLGFKLLKIDPRHRVFLFMEFVKVNDAPRKRPQITLKPCLYKKR